MKNVFAIFILLALVATGTVTAEPAAPQKTAYIQADVPGFFQMDLLSPEPFSRTSLEAPEVALRLRSCRLTNNRVLWVTRFGQSRWSPTEASWDGYSQLADSLALWRFDLALADAAKPLTDELLAPYRVLVLGAMERNFSSKEKDALTRFLANGGGILLLGGLNRSDPEGIDDGKADLAAKWDLSFGTRLNSGERAAITRTGRLHVIANGPESISSTGSAYIEPGSGWTSLFADGDAVTMASREIGPGKVLVAADGRILVNSAVKPAIGLASSDNVMAIRSAFFWLADHASRKVPIICPSVVLEVDGTPYYFPNIPLGVDDTIFRVPVSAGILSTRTSHTVRLLRLFDTEFHYPNGLPMTWDFQRDLTAPAVTIDPPSGSVFSALPTRLTLKVDDASPVKESDSHIRFLGLDFPLSSALVAKRGNGTYELNLADLTHAKLPAGPISVEVSVSDDMDLGPNHVTTEYVTWTYNPIDAPVPSTPTLIATITPTGEGTVIAAQTEGEVTARILNMLGQEIKVLGPFTGSTRWDGLDADGKPLTSGAYRVEILGTAGRTILNYVVALR